MSTMTSVSPSERIPQNAATVGARRSVHCDENVGGVEDQRSYSTFDLTSQKLAFMCEIVRRECKCFIEESNQEQNLPENDKLCVCGYLKSQHDKNVEELSNPGVTWDYSLHTKTLPTNAFGEIEFVGFGVKYAKYVRVDVDTKMETMLDHLTSAWGMEKPNLLISVTGGAKNFTMKARLRELFGRGLMKAALSTGALVVTGGTNTGVMKLVGEAVRDFGLTSEGRVMTIGIASWGCVQSKGQLISDDCLGKWPASYRIDSKKENKKENNMENKKENKKENEESFLDPNHTHFILVDNGTQHKFKVEILFRAKLEKAIAAQKTGHGADAVDVPICLLVLEGGRGTLQAVYDALNSGTPTVVIKGSGKTADILAYAYQNARENHSTVYDQSEVEIKETNYVLDPHVITEIKKQVKKHLGEASLDKHFEWVKDCCSKRDLLSVFELDSKNSAKDVDLAILGALFKAQKNKQMDQLKLALAWNRIDVAKSEIFTDDKESKMDELDELMMSAIQLNRVDFVDLFLHHGVLLKDFVTVKRLNRLYNNIPDKCLLYKLLQESVKKRQQNSARSKEIIELSWGKTLHFQNSQFINELKIVIPSPNRPFTLEDVGYLIKELLGDYYKPHYLSKESQYLSDEKQDEQNPHSNVPGEASKCGQRVDFPNPAHELFIWAVLMNNHQLSKLFWREGKHSFPATLFATSILSSMESKRPGPEIRRKMQDSSEDYPQLAIAVINNCYSSNEKMTLDLLTQQMPYWGESTCFQLVVKSGNKEFFQTFVAQEAFQALLNSTWMGEMAQDNSLFWIISCTILFPLVQFRIKFQEVDSKTEEKENLSVESSQMEKKDKSKLKEEIGWSRNNHNNQTRQMTVHNLEPTTAKQKNKGYSPLEKHRLFYRSPVVKFSLNVISYIIFLLLYSYYLVVQLSREFHFLEGFLIVWVFTMFIEEIRQSRTVYASSIKSKVTAYLNNWGNILDITSISLFCLGMILRFIDDDSCLSAARIILSINLITFFSRILHIFSANKQLGPKLVMIHRMIQDLMSFVIILLLFVVTYGISSEAVLYPNSELSWLLVYNLLRKAYWQIYGELFLDDIAGIPSCSNNPANYSNYETLRCPSPVGKYYVPILLGVYVLMTNILLLNLLIAMFSYTFQQVQENTDMHWCFQRFNLIYDYTHRPVLPPPLIIFSHIYIIISRLCNKCGLLTEKDEFRKFLNKREENQLMQWENAIASSYHNSLEKVERDSLAKRMEMVLTKVDEIQKAQSMTSPTSMSNQVMSADSAAAKRPLDIEMRMETLENQFIHTSNALKMIMNSLQENNMAAKSEQPILPDLQKPKEEGI